MKKGKLGTAPEHYDLGPRFEAGLKFLQSRDLQSLALGRYGVLGNECYVIIDEYTTKPRSAKRWEAHRRYADIQLIVSGSETIGCTDIANLRGGDYDGGKDIEFLEPNDADGEFIELSAGDYMILWPQDAHMPGIAAGEPQPVRKAVVKVLL